MNQTSSRCKPPVLGLGWSAFALVMMLSACAGGDASEPEGLPDYPEASGAVAEMDGPDVASDGTPDSPGGEGSENPGSADTDPASEQPNQPVDFTQPTGEEPNGAAAGDEAAPVEPDPAAPEDAPSGPPIDSPIPDVSGRGFLLGGTCYRGCVNGDTDPDADGFGFEGSVSCIVGGSAPALQGTACDPNGVINPSPVVAPPPAPVPVAPDVSSRGFLLDGTCFVGCASAATDADANGTFDGFGFENGESCIVGNSAPAAAAGDCDPSAAPTVAPSDPGDGDFGRDPNGVCPPANQITCPLGLPREQCGCFIIPGLGNRKAEVLNTAVAAGADALDFLASGSFETETYNTDYPFGDVFPDGRSKTGGAANFGITKMNWFMIRQCHPAYRGLTDGDFQRGAEINDDLFLEATIYRECHDFFGGSWLAGHRNGPSGINNPNTADIQRFVGVYAWLQDMYGDGHLTDDTRWFTNVPAI